MTRFQNIHYKCEICEKNLRCKLKKNFRHKWEKTKKRKQQEEEADEETPGKVPARKNDS